MRPRGGVIVIEHESVKSVAIVIDSIVQICKGSDCKQSVFVELLDSNDFVDFFSDVNRLIELNLYVEFKVVNELSSREGQGLFLADRRGTVHTGLGTVDQLGDRVARALRHTDPVRAIVTVRADQAILGSYRTGLADRTAVLAGGQAQVGSIGTKRNAAFEGVVFPEG